jgi:hypothetical protein
MSKMRGLPTGQLLDTHAGVAALLPNMCPAPEKEDQPVDADANNSHARDGSEQGCNRT